MRFFLFGPRFFGVRPGVSFRPDEISLKNPSAKPRAPTGSFVYVVENGRGSHKVGWTANPSARLVTLQTGSPDALKFSYVASASGRGYEIEQSAHEILSAYRGVGEWFVVPADMAVAALSTAAFRFGENLLQVTPAQADEILRVAASMPPETGKRAISGFTWFCAALVGGALFAEHRFMGDDAPAFMTGTAVAGLIMLPVLAKYC